MKKLFYLLSSLLFIFARCGDPADGTIVETTLRVVDMQDNPLQGVTLNLINTRYDSFTVTASSIVEQTKTTDSKGQVTFTYAYRSLRNRLIAGEAKGNLRPIGIYGLGPSSSGSPNLKYDSLVTISIRFMSAFPNMKTGEMAISLDSELSGLPLSRLTFPIYGNQIDTLFKTQVFSKPGFNVDFTIKFPDTVRFRSVRVLKDGKRDEVMTVVL